MAFGKKQAPQDNWQLDRGAGIDINTIRAVQSPNSGSGAGFILLSVAVVAFVFLGSLVGFMMMGGGSVAKPTSTTAAGFDAIDSELLERCLKPISSKYATLTEADGKPLLSVEEESDFLGCSMSIYTQRFCESRYRIRLVSQLETYGVLVKRQLAFNRSGLGQMYRQAADNMEMVHTGKIGLTRRRKPGFVPLKLREALRSLTQNGILTREDFSSISGPPDIIAPYILEPERDACERNKSWVDWLFG